MTPGSRDVFRLDGRSALVTGAGSGVGEAIARAFAAAGAAVLVTDIDKDAAVAAAESISTDGGTAQPFVLDVRDSTAAAEATAAAAELGGGALHILVNNAGAIAPAMFEDMSEEKFRRIVDIHLVGSFVCSQAALHTCRPTAPGASSTSPPRPASPGRSDRPTTGPPRPASSA